MATSGSLSPYSRCSGSVTSIVSPAGAVLAYGVVSCMDVQLDRQTAALDGGAQYLLTGTRVLVRHPAAVNQHSAVVINQDEQVRALAASHARVRHEGSHQDVAHPALVGTFGFEATERPWLASYCCAVQTASAQMLADGALRHIDAMPGFQNGGDLSGGASRQFHPQLAGFLQ